VQVDTLQIAAAEGYIVACGDGVGIVGQTHGVLLPVAGEWRVESGECRETSGVGEGALRAYGEVAA